MTEEKQPVRIGTGKQVHREIDETLKESSKGYFSMLDIDCIRYLNDHFGEPYGRQVLKSVIILLQEHFAGEDIIIGKVKDERFILYSKDHYGMLKEAIAEVDQEIREMSLLKSLRNVILTTYCLCRVRQQDSYVELTLRAEKKMLESRIKTREKLSFRNRAEQLLDLKYYDTDTFMMLKMHYRQVEHLLLSVSLQAKGSVYTKDHEERMAQLKEIIDENLRQGDFFTRQGGNRYLLFCRGLAEEHIVNIRERIDESYYRRRASNQGLRISRCEEATRI